MEKILEKVKVTKEQAEMIENHRKHFETLMSKRITKHCPTVIDKMPVEDVVRAFIDGYEVEPEFKVGDWVVHRHGGIGYIKRAISSVVETDTNVKDNIHEFRHATPEEIQQEKERRWWAKHGREVWQIMSGDILHYEFSNKVSVVKNFKDGCVYFQDNEQDLVDELKNHYKVICFAENRLDLNA
ncbi:hypothetical protein [Ornithinibacillus bavariensis]|uniref:hypothetical protein n=1 Tax=Ornithinibacillus bavariensis TaxID=545502 RepID=UPI000EE0ABEE|nr:hypothetical protein [Ornithinibacillus sp.]